MHHWRYFKFSSFLDLHIFQYIGKNMFGVVISSVHFGWGLFCDSNFNFFYIDKNIDRNKLITRKQSIESLTIARDIQVLQVQTKQPESLLQLYQIFYCTYKKLLQRFYKSICLVKKIVLGKLLHSSF